MYYTAQIVEGIKAVHECSGRDVVTITWMWLECQEYNYRVKRDRTHLGMAV